jgi:ATP adenylyltransferase
VDVLWSPWRYDYIKSDKTIDREGCSSCVFCSIIENSASDEEKFILHRAEFNFVILNIYPYTGGHLMVIPYEHCSEIADLPDNAAHEMMDLTKRAQAALKKAYQPQGYNLGMNLGSAAGAGVAEHLHLHVLPRWSGDVNFMTAIGQTRTIPETLVTTYSKLKPHF